MSIISTLVASGARTERAWPTSPTFTIDFKSLAMTSNTTLDTTLRIQVAKSIKVTKNGSLGL